MAIRRRKLTRSSAEINMTSLGDIALSLLLGFLVITPIIIQTLSADLPRSGSGPSAGRTKQEVIVALTAEEKILVNGEEVAEEDLPAKLEELFPPGADVDRKVMFTGSGEVGYERVIHLMDVLKENGIETIGIR